MLAGLCVMGGLGVVAYGFLMVVSRQRISCFVSIENNRDALLPAQRKTLELLPVRRARAPSRTPTHVTTRIDLDHKGFKVTPNRAKSRSCNSACMTIRSSNAYGSTFFTARSSTAPTVARC